MTLVSLTQHKVIYNSISCLVSYTPSTRSIIFTSSCLVGGHQHISDEGEEAAMVYRQDDGLSYDGCCGGLTVPLVTKGNYILSGFWA